MGDHHDRLAELVDGAPHERQDLAAGRAVEVAGRLVGEDDRRSAGERAGDGDALLLATRQLARAVRQPVAQADRVDHVVDPRRVALGAAEHQRQRDVLLGGERRDQVVRLEHEPDLLAAQFGEVLVVERGEVRVADVDGALGERVEPGEAVQQRRLAGSRRTHDRREPAGFERDRHAVEGVDGRVTDPVDLLGIDRAGGGGGRGRCRRGWRSCRWFSAVPALSFQHVGQIDVLGGVGHGTPLLTRTIMHTLVVVAPFVPYARGLMACPSCARPVPEGARFCPACGHSLAVAHHRGTSGRHRACSPTWSGFTTLAEFRDPEQVKRFVDAAFEGLVADVERFGGRVDKVLGDAIVALFGAPVAHEDDAERAVRAGLQMQATLRRFIAQQPAVADVKLRIGINTGEVLVGTLARTDYTAMGDVVNIASRLQELAPEGGVLVGDATARAVLRRDPLRAARAGRAAGP